VTSGYSGKYVILCVTKRPKKLVGLEKTAGEQRVKKISGFVYFVMFALSRGEYIHATETWISSGLVGFSACMQTLHYLINQQFRLVVVFVMVVNYIVTVFVAVVVDEKKNPACFPLVFFFRDCLTEHIRLATDPEIQCPHQEDDFACHATITGQEIQAVSNLELGPKAY